MNKSKFRQYLGIISTVAMVIELFAPFMVGTASAATTWTSVMLRLDRHTAGATTATICAKPVATRSSNIVDTQIIWPGTNFTIGTITVNTTSNASWPAGASAWPALGSVSTSTLTTTITQSPTNASMTLATLYCFNVTGGLTTTGAANDLTGTIKTRAAGPTDLDTGSFGTSVIAGSDNFTVNAVVPQLFTYVGPDVNPDNFSANLSNTVVRSTAGSKITLSTNANKGWITWARGGNATAGLFSAGASNTIASTVAGCPVTSTTGTEQYTSLVTTAHTSGTGTPAAATNFASGIGCGLAGSGGLFTQIASSNGTGNGDTVTLTEKANIQFTTPAGGDYTDTITVIAAGVF